MNSPTRLYQLQNGRRIRAEDACHVLRLYCDMPPVGLKTQDYDITVVNTGEVVRVKWDGKKATMVWPKDKQ